MIVPSQIRRRYDGLQPFLEAVATMVRETVSGYCAKQGFAYIGRLKSVESLAEKIETGRFEKWSDLDDLFGCAVVIPTLADEPAVLEFLGTVFDRVRLRKRGTTLKPPDAFRFEATRFYGRLKLISRTPSTDPVFGTTFEVQIRTAFEHAWSVTTHAIYKSGTISWKARRLAAQLKAAVEQLDSLVLAFEESAKTIVEHDWPDLLIQQEIVTRLSALSADRAIPAELTPKDWSRFAENLFGLLRASRKWPRRESRSFATDAIDKLETEVRSLGPDRMPRSVSLFQLAFGVLARDGFLESLNDFVPLVTDELSDLYPAVDPFRAHCFNCDG